MREFHFWGSWDDSFAILGAILDTGKASAFASKPYLEPKARLFDKLTPELEEIAMNRGRVYLWLPGISTLPIEFERWDSGKYVGQYYVTGRGPYLDLVLPACYEDGPEGARPAKASTGVLQLNAGGLYCNHEFYVSNPGILVKMPQAAQQRDEEFRKIIKAHCKRYGPKKRYVGHNAIKLLEEGKAEVVSPGYYR